MIGVCKLFYRVKTGLIYKKERIFGFIINMKRIVWKEGNLVSLKLKDDLYTFAQMCRSPYMRFFDLSCVDGSLERNRFCSI